MQEAGLVQIVCACSKDGALLPHLIVVPLSTLPNWEREFTAWAPHLNIVVLHGNQAARDCIKTHELYSSSKGTLGATQVIFFSDCS